MDNSSLGNRLKELREFNGYTQEYIADILGVVRQTYSHYENGKRTIAPDQLCKLADLYSISLDVLLRIKPEKEKVRQAVKEYEATNIAQYIEFINSPDNVKKYQRLDRYEKEIVYYFSKISVDDKKEIIEFTKIKAKKKKKNTLNKES